ncbi:NAD-dependent epimerase/dehydratase family protein [Nevskia soli]|uniref:NAD-dependent epimerase/dehydratase family protein n=1 Tax=Nevskia soli TaxID=418856 RepID=UPI0004A768D3|nr:NAD-dependent epimerase/dehydratase family protein [Nevskia soli]
MARTALIAGSTGLIGSLLLPKLLASPAYDRVVAVTRRPLALSHPKLSNPPSDFEHLGQLGAQLAADDVYCCLGTTTAKAGGQAGLERVDYHMVVDLARSARAAGARQFVVVSAVGAALRSPAFYSRVKARMERSVAEAGYATVHILRPSLLLGARQEARLAEDIAQKVSPLLSPLFIGRLSQYRPVQAEQVADAMLTLALRPSSGVHIHHYPFID